MNFKYDTCFNIRIQKILRYTIALLLKKLFILSKEEIATIITNVKFNKAQTNKNVVGTLAACVMEEAITKAVISTQSAYRLKVATYFT